MIALQIGVVGSHVCALGIAHRCDGRRGLQEKSTCGSCAFGCQDAWRLGAFVTSYVDKLRGDMFNDDVRHRASDTRSLSSSLLVAIFDESPGLNTLASVKLLGTGLVVC